MLCILPRLLNEMTSILEHVRREAGKEGSSQQLGSQQHSASAVFGQRLVLVSHPGGMPCIPQPAERDDL